MRVCEFFRTIFRCTTHSRSWCISLPLTCDKCGVLPKVMQFETELAKMFVHDIIWIAELFMILKLGTLTVRVSLLGGQSCEIVWLVSRRSRLNVTGFKQFSPYLLDCWTFLSWQWCASVSVQTQWCMNCDVWVAVKVRVTGLNLQRNVSSVHHGS